MTLHGYEEVDHTADLALRVWGEDFQVLLRQAADGLYTLMGIVPQHATSQDISFSVPQGSPETIIVDFLSELVYLVEEIGRILSDFAFVEGDHEISIRAISKKIFTQARAIKAVTFHDLNVKNTAQGFEATITFDV